MLEVIINEKEGKKICPLCYHLVSKHFMTLRVDSVIRMTYLWVGNGRCTSYQNCGCIYYNDCLGEEE